MQMPMDKEEAMLHFNHLIFEKVEKFNIAHLDTLKIKTFLVDCESFDLSSRALRKCFALPTSSPPSIQVHTYRTTIKINFTRPDNALYKLLSAYEQYACNNVLADTRLESLISF